MRGAWGWARVGTALAAGLFTLACAPESAVIPVSGGFPAVQTVAASGTVRALPQSLPAERGVLVLLFAEDQIPVANAWTATLTAVAPSVPILVVPLIDTPEAIARTGEAAAFRRQTLRPAEGVTVEALFADRLSVITALGIRDTANLRVFALDRRGRILGRTVGRPTARKRNEITRALGL